jgi:hypothetical protein
MSARARLHVFGFFASLPHTAPKGVEITQREGRTVGDACFASVSLPQRRVKVLYQ